MSIEEFKEKNLIDRFFSSVKVERFFFALTCATVFTVGMCHWLLDLGYKYRWEDDTTNVVDFTWVFVVGMLISLYYVIRKKSVKFDLAFVLLCQGQILAEIIDYHNAAYVEIPYAFIIPVAYIVGKCAIGTDIKRANYRIEILYFSLAIGIFITALLDFLMDYKYTSIYGWQTENWPGFWLGGNWENRCTMEFGFVLISATAGYLILCAKRNVFTLIFLIQANLVIQRLVIAVEGRENRLILPMAVAFTITLLILDKWKQLPKKVHRLIRCSCLVMIVGIGLVVLAFLHNWFGLHDRYLQSNWSAGGGVFTNVRFSLNWNGFKAMLAHPLDDYNAHDGLPKAHSMLLEYGRAYDVTVWGILTLTRMLLIVDAVRLVFRRNDYSWIKYLLLPAFAAVNMYYSMEPNGFAHRYFWMVGLFISGMIRGWLDLKENN